MPIEPGDDWPQKPMTILRSRPPPTGPADDGRPAAYTNIVTHWWDGSQIYGSDLKRQLLIRSDPETGKVLPDGKIGLTPNGHLPIEPLRDETADAEGAKFPDLELAGVNGNWWLGLSAMHTLFAREHNAVVDRLKVDYPDGRRRVAVSEGAAGRDRAHRQDPHHRVDARAHELAGRAVRHARKLVGDHRRALLARLRPTRRRRGESPASPVRPAARTRRPMR